MMSRITVVSALVLASASLTASADVTQSYRFTVQSSASSVHTDLTAGASLTGTLLGNYDVDTNPTGTRTIPGLFGPTTGNTPIPFTGTAGFTGADTTHPAGTWYATLDLTNNTVTVSGLSLDVLNARDIGVTLGLTIEYDTFRTRQPTAVFFGGIPLPIPFGQVSLQTLTLVQGQTPGGGVLTQTGPDRYSATMIAPVSLTASIQTLTDPVDIGPIVVPLPLVLDIQLTPSGATASFSFDQAFEQEFPLNVDLPADQALDLPTVLPPGSTAHLIANGTLGSLTTSLAVTGSVVAAGSLQSFARADWNRDGVVNSMDFYAFLVEFLAIGVDFNGDTRMDSQDFYDFVMVYFESR